MILQTLSFISNGLLPTDSTFLASNQLNTSIHWLLLMHCCPCLCWCCKGNAITFFSILSQTVIKLLVLWYLLNLIKSMFFYQVFVRIILKWCWLTYCIESVYTEAKKKICVFTVTCQKNLGSVCRHFFFIIGKTGNSRYGIRFRYFIFEISGKPSFVEAVFINYDELRSFSTFFALNFDKTSGWINKTLLLIKQQKWLSEFCKNS